MVEDAGHLAPFSRRRIAVIRRCRTTLALAALAALGIAGVADRAYASSITAGTTANTANYSFTNTTSGTLTQIVAEIRPAGSVAPPASNVSPLTILPGSSGFDSTQLIDSLGTGKLANGDPLQVLEIQFGTGGLKPGGVLDFSLSLKDATSASPSLFIDSPATGIQQLPYTPPSSPGSDGSGTGTQAGGGSTTVTNAIPEPLSLTLWSVAAGLCLLRARVFRRARQIED
jgi:hypothetical protein